MKSPNVPVEPVDLSVPDAPQAEGSDRQVEFTPKSFHAPKARVKKNRCPESSPSTASACPEHSRGACDKLSSGLSLRSKTVESGREPVGRQTVMPIIPMTPRLIIITAMAARKRLKTLLSADMPA